MKLSSTKKLKLNVVRAFDRSIFMHFLYAVYELSSFYYTNIEADEMLVSFLDWIRSINWN